MERRRSRVYRAAMLRTASIVALALAGCALRPYTFGASEGSSGAAATTSTTGAPPSQTTAHVDGGGSSVGDGTADGSLGKHDLGAPPPAEPLWPPAPCESDADCPSGQCVDPEEDYDQEHSDATYCLAPVPPPLQCDPWRPEPGCPEGYKCVHPTWDGSRPGCVPVLPGGLPPGAACEKLAPYAIDEYGYGLFLDDCDAGSGCYFGECRTFCEFDEAWTPHCPPGFVCGAGRISLWCVPFCDPLLQDCDEGFVCVGAGGWPEFECVADGSGAGGQVFDACEAVNGCDPGLLCATPIGAVECDQAAPGCCLPYCDTSAAPQCPGAGQTCVAWYEPGQAPPGFETLGVCFMPR